MKKEEYIKLNDNMILSGAYGEKAKNLFKLKNWGFCISPGYAISIEVFIEYCKDNKFNVSKGHYVQREKYLLSDHVKNVLEEIWDKADKECGGNIAVRSSADGEDTQGASAAGIYESVLNIRTYSEFEKAVITVWNSFFSQAAIRYREDFDIISMGMGIVIEKMVLGTFSGVLFTVNPTNGKNQIVLEATQGLTENIVSDRSLASIYLVEKKCNEQGIYNGYETKCPDGKSMCSISEILLGDLCSKAIAIEKMMGSGCDLEWTVDNDKIIFLQLRYISADSREQNIPYATMNQEKNNCVLLDRYSVPASILYLSLLEHWQELVYLDFENNKLGKCFQEKPLLMYYNRVYWNIDYQHKYFSMAGFGDETKKKFLVEEGYEQWYNKLPIYQKRLDEYAERIDKAKKIQDLQGCLQEVLNNFCSYIGIDHYRMLGMANICYEQLTNMLKFSENPKASVSRLLQSVNLKNMTEKSNDKLVELASYIKSQQGISECVSNSDKKKVLQILMTDHKFADRFNDFIKEHGHRGISSDDLMYPHWEEEPSYIIDIIYQLIREEDMVNEKSICTETLDEVLAELQENNKLSEDDKKEMEKMTHLTARYMTLREDQRYYFDKSWVLLRRIFLKIADSMLSDGIIKERGDVFCTQIDEIFSYLSDRTIGISKQQIYRRRKAFQRNISITPPYYIKDGKTIKIQKEGYTKRYKGTVICSGYVEGSVKIIKSSRDLEKVQKGDIIVVPTFHPSWTPIFRSAGGMVMNYGNILSHGSVMAREYGIPVVAFNGVATEVFKDGEKIIIDAIAGRIIRAIDNVKKGDNA